MYEPDVLDEDRPEPPDTHQIGREAPDETDMEQCDSCGYEKPLEGGDSVVVFTHRIEGRAVAEDREWICADCIREFKEEAWDRACDEARWERGDRWM